MNNIDYFFLWNKISDNCRFFFLTFHYLYYIKNVRNAKL